MRTLNELRKMEQVLKAETPLDERFLKEVQKAIRERGG
jgi:hypothetical protein